MISTSFRTMDRPNPVPPKRRVVELSACVNGMNSRSRTERGDAHAGIEHRECEIGATVVASILADIDEDVTALGKRECVADQVRANIAGFVAGRRAGDAARRCVHAVTSSRSLVAA